MRDDLGSEHKRQDHFPHPAAAERRRQIAITSDTAISQRDADCRHRLVASATVNGVRVDGHSVHGLAELVAELLVCGRSHVVRFIPAYSTVLAHRDPDYRELLNGSTANLPDGIGVVWAMRLSGRRVKRLPGSEGLEALAQWGEGAGLRHYFYGGAEDVLQRLRRRLTALCPAIELAGSEAPPFEEASEDRLAAAAARMRETGADLVWVGLGTPKQDVAAEILRRHSAAPVILCVGAAFDFVSGAKARAPRWVQRLGLEWLHRLLSEPGRLWKRYLVGNPEFVALVLSHALRRRVRWGRASASP